MNPARRRTVWPAIQALLDETPPDRWTEMMSAADVREVAAVHELGGHSYSHESMEHLGDAEFTADLDKCSSLLEAMGRRLTVYAFPGLDARYFDRKYFENPAGDVIAHVADAGDRLAAFYGVIPEPWSVAGVEVTVHQSMDTMTHPAFRRRGLFVQLAELTYEAVRAGTGPMQLVGIPGRQSLGGFTNRLGWNMIHEFDLIGVPAIVPRAWPRFRRGRVSVEMVPEPDERVHAVLNESPSRATVVPRLAGAFFDWRVFGCSPKRLRVALACDRGDPVAVCVYALTGPRSTMISYLASVSGVPRREWFLALLRFVSGQGGALLYTWRPQHQDLASLYAAAGFRATPFRHGPLVESRPLIVKSDSRIIYAVDWEDANVFDLQPLMQD